MGKRLTTIAIAAVLTAAAAAPAIAQTDEKLTGLERAHQAAAEAVELSAYDGGGPAPAIPPGPTGKNKADKGNPGKGNSGDAPGGEPGNSANAPGANQDDSKRLTGRQRAAQAIKEAINWGNGNAFGHGHAAEVLQQLMITGESPSSLEVDENHGAEVAEMVRTYNELRKQERDA